MTNIAVQNVKELVMVRPVSLKSKIEMKKNVNVIMDDENYTFVPFGSRLRSQPERWTLVWSVIWNEPLVQTVEMTKLTFEQQGFGSMKIAEYTCRRNQHKTFDISLISSNILLLGVPVVSRIENRAVPGYFDEVYVDEDLRIVCSDNMDISVWERI
jgi:hypothetical protein